MVRSELPWSEKGRKWMVFAYKADFSISEIAEVYGIEPKEVLTILREEGVTK